jgi:hypothetical protein
MRQKVRRYMQEIEEDLLYRGDLFVGGVKFEYELRLLIPLSQLGVAENMKEVRGVLKITIRREGEVIPLTDEEYDVFLAFLMDLVDRCRELRIAGDPHGVVCEKSIRLHPEVGDMLRAPKFRYAS